MPFDSSYWTLAEAIVWIATRDERRVDTLGMIRRNSLMRLRIPDEAGALLANEGREGRAKLLHALEAGKISSTGVILAEGARNEIPSAAWANIRLSESQHMNRALLKFKMFIADDAAINAQMVVGEKVLHEWKDVRVSRSAVLGEWPRDQRTAQSSLNDADLRANREAPVTTLQTDQQQAEWHSIFQHWAGEQNAAGVIITQGAAIKAMRQQIGDRATGLSDRVIIGWTRALEPSWTAQRGQRTG